MTAPNAMGTAQQQRRIHPEYAAGRKAAIENPMSDSTTLAKRAGHSVYAIGAAGKARCAFMAGVVEYRLPEYAA